MCACHELLLVWAGLVFVIPICALIAHVTMWAIYWCGTHRREIV